jgi:pimeloyl-ACP methyl ester carboxylesterase
MRTTMRTPYRSFLLCFPVLAGLALSSCQSDDPKAALTEERPTPVDLTLASQVFGPSPTLASICDGADILKMEMPVYHGRPDSPKFTYRFRVRIANLLAPTVVMLPGGPQALIGTYDGYGSLPPSFNRIETDPRGEGCNRTETFLPLDAYTSEQIVGDTLEMIRALNLKNYYLYGVSFGSIHGTKLTYLLERSGLTLPKATVIGGVLGKPFADYHEYFASYNREWDLVKAKLSPRIRDQLTRDPVAIMGYTRAHWAALISHALKIGEIAGSGEPLVQILNALDSPDATVVQRARQLIAAFFDQPPAVYQGPASTVVACREYLGGTRHTMVELIDGRIVPSGDACAPLGLKQDLPFDAADYPIERTPLYYVQGANDPATPLAGAAYHFLAQTRAQRTFLAVGRSAHGPLENTFGPRGCSDEFWNSVAYYPQGIGLATLACAWPISVTQRGPGQ